jgi:hypothetical protein
METHNIFEEDRRFNQSLTGTERIRNEKLEPILNSISNIFIFYLKFLVINQLNLNISINLLLYLY